MNNWKKINDVNLYYIKFNLLPNLLAFGLAYSFFNNILLDISIYEYFNNVFALFNITNISVKEQFKLVDNILINKYKLMIVDVEKIDIIKIKK